MLAKYKDIDDMFIVDLDKQRLVLDNSDLALPEFVVKGFKIDLCNLTQKSVNEHNERNLQIQRCFMRIFMKTIGNYENFIVPSCDSDKE